jgi:two-component system, chemotaxis family, chemotaxis protein CheY
MAKILVVDDDTYLRGLSVKLLEQAGYQVIEAADGVEGVEKFEEERPDAVLLDINMPRMDGLNTLVAIRRINHKARVAMLTGITDKKIALTAVQMGARDYVVKPFKVERVLLAVQRLLEPGKE